MKQALPLYLKFKAAVMQKRKDQHESKMQAYIAKKGKKLQAKIIKNAKS